MRKEYIEKEEICFPEHNLLETEECKNRLFSEERIDGE